MSRTPNCRRSGRASPLPILKIANALCSARIYSTAFALALALLAGISTAAAAGFPSGATLGAQPDLAVSLNPPDGPGYVIAARCSPDEPLVSFLLRVTNVGSINSQPISEDKAVTVTDTTDIWWTAGAPLGTIGVGQRKRCASIYSGALALAGSTSSSSPSTQSHGLTSIPSTTTN